MKKILTLLVLLAFNKVTASVNDDLTKIYQLIQEDRKAAINLVLELKHSNDELDDDLWKVRSNFYLAYSYKLEGEFGKSVIHYLEAIRHSNNASYDGIISEKISLHKNLGNIFQQFKAHDLATKYNLIALELAESSKNDKESISIKFNQSRNLRSSEEYDASIDLFKSILPDSDESRVPRIINEIAVVYMLKEDWSNAKFHFEKLMNIKSTTQFFKAKALHNLAEIENKKGNIEEAINKLIASINIKESLAKKDNKSLFISYKTLGEYFLAANLINKAGIYLEKGEELTSEINMSFEHFSIYELLSEYNYLMGDISKYQYYSNLYSNKLKSYINLQEEIQETDKRYNMDLITKRYFDEVAKQEKIASILFYSRLISGSLLMLLLAVVGYNRYEKIRVRRRIEDHLVQLEMWD